MSFIFFNPFIFLALSAFGTRQIPRGYVLLCKATFPLICLKCNWIQFQRVPCRWPFSPLCTSDKGHERKEEKKGVAFPMPFKCAGHDLPADPGCWAWPHLTVCTRDPVTADPATLTVWPHPWTRLTDQRGGHPTRGRVCIARCTGTGWVDYFLSLEPEQQKYRENGRAKRRDLAGHVGVEDWP